MKNRKTLKSCLALLLTLVMLFSVMTPMMSFTATALTVDTSNIGENTKLTSKTDYAVAPGITESHIITHNKDGSNQVQAYALEIDLNNPDVGLIAGYKDYMNDLAAAPSWGMQTVRDQAAAAESYHKTVLNKPNFEVVGGINCDFFNMQTGAPMGSLVMNGVTYNSTSNSYFAILDDGTAVIGSGAIPENAKEVVGGSAMLVQNGVINPNIKENPDVFPRSTVGLTADGKVILVTADGRQAPSSCGQTMYENAQQMLSLGCVSAMQVDGGGSATLVSQREGETSLSVRNSPSDGVERIVSTALLVYSNATPDGEFHHANLAPVNELYTPGSTVEFTATAVDGAGASAELPAEGYFALADETTGEIDPATGVFTAAEGFAGDVVVNYMVNGEVKGSTSVSIVIPETLYVASAEQAVGPGVETNFGIVAKYQDRDVIMKSGDIAWSIVDKTTGDDLNNVAGAFNGLTFTGAEDGAFNTTVTAKLVCNEGLDPLVLTVFVGSKQVKLYDFEYVTGEENKDAPNYVSSFHFPTYSATWLSNNSSSNGAIAAELYEKDIPLYIWPNAGVGDTNNTTAKADIVSAADGEPVRFGEQSLRIQFDYANYNFQKNANFYLRVTDPLYRFEGSPTAMGCWVYAPEGTTAYRLYLQCANGIDLENNTYNKTSYQDITTAAAKGDAAGSKEGITWTGWKYLEFDLTGTKGFTGTSNVGGAYEPFGMYQSNGVFWISYQPSNMGTNVTADTIYVDDIVLIYGANTSDTHNPEINYIGDFTEQIVDGETVYTSNVNTFKAQYADFEDKYMTGIDDDATKMYIDGVDVTDMCYIDEGNDEIYFYGAVLPDGEHVIEIEVSDVFGNKTTEMRYFTIDSGSEDTEVAFEAENAPVLGEDFILNIVSNNAADIASADIEIKVLSFFTSYWRDVEVVPAPGFKLDGEAVYNAIRDTLSFRLVRDTESAVFALRQDKLASIITKVPADTPENLEVTHRISKGAITYLSGASDVVTAFSGKLVSTCEAPLVISVDTMLVGTEGGNIYVTDSTGNAVEGAEVYAGETLLGTTDAEGKLFTAAFVDAVKEFTLTASKTEEVTPADPDNGIEAEYKVLRSFTFKSQSYDSRGGIDATPSYIKLNAVKTPWNAQSISWMSNPLFTDAKAVVRYAEKAVYDAEGEATVFAEFEGKSFLEELSSTGVIETNYAVRFNSVNFSGLKENTEYVFMVGDGTTWSAIKTFTTSKANIATDFFILADIQNTDITDIDRVNAVLGETGIDFDFGIHTGDIVDNAGEYAYWEAAGSSFSTGVLGNTDIFHALGNHEYTGDFYGANASHYYDLPGTADEAPEAYSVEYGNIYMASIGFLSSLAEYASATEWVKEDAAKSDATWKFLVVHQPPYYPNPGGAMKGYRELMTALADEADLDFVFSGHDHAYARTQPITAGLPDAENGTVYFVCGNVGGKGYDAVNEPAHYYDVLVDYKDYDAVYMTVRATDTEFTVNAFDAKKTGESVLLDTYTVTKANDCAAAGHDWMLDNGWLECAVCGYAKEVADYTGFVKDAETGRAMKLVNGVPETGWVEINGEIFYFDENGVAGAGDTVVGEYTYPLDENGKLTKFAFLLEDGTLATNRWVGERYLGNDGLAVTGEYEVTEEVKLNDYDTAEKAVVTLKYTFDENGNLVKGAFNKVGNDSFYYLAGQPQRGWFNIEGDWYYFDRKRGGAMAHLGLDGNTSIDKDADGKYPVESSDGTSLLFTFDEDGKLVEGALSETTQGLVYYWANNERLTGWFMIDGDFYYFSPVDFFAVTGEQVIDEKTYTFTDAGVLALVEENFEFEGLYYYFDAESTIVENHIKDHPYTKRVLNGVDPTCTKPGMTSGERCSTCNTYVVRPTNVDPLGHDMVTDDAVEPTCTETGLTEGSHCSRCDDETTEQKEVPALGHSYEAVVTAPTCTSVGYTTYTCTVCDDTYVADEVATLDHDYVMVSLVEPDCENDGYMALTCSVCGDNFDEVIPALGHNGVWEIVEEPAIGVDGLKWEVCIECGAIIEEVIIPALEEVTEEDSTGVDEPASEEVSEEESTEAPEVHECDFVGVVVLAPTCTEDGLKIYACECGESYEVIIAATGHNGVWEVVIPAEIGVDGLKELVCTECGVILAEEIIPALENVTEEESSEVVEESTEAPEVHEHDYVAVVVTEPTCTEDGLMVYTCECGESYEEVIAATGHNGVWETVIPAEIGVNGLKQLVCTVCGAVLDEEVIPALEDASEEASEEATTVETTTETVVDETTTEAVVDETTTEAVVDETTTVVADKETTTVDTSVKSRLGDVDLNGKITAADARLALRIAAKLEPTATAEMLYAAEVTGDGKIEAKDARRILRVSAKLDKESDFGKDIAFPIQ